MRLVINANRVSAAIDGEYVGSGSDQAIIDAPSNFDVARIALYSYDETTGALSSLADTIVQQIKDIRDARVLLGYPIVSGTDTLWFQSDYTSRSQQTILWIIGTQMKAAGAADAALVNPVPWKTMGPDYVPLNVALAVKLIPAIAAQEGNSFAHAKALIDAVNAAEDPLSIDINAGWPPVYGE